MLAGLGHGTVGRGNDEDRAVHLGSARDHVFNVVRVSGAVNVSVVTAGRFILNVSGVNRNTACFLFGRLIDFIVAHFLCLTLASHYHRNSSSQRGFTVVNVSDRTDVDVRLASVEFCLCHFCKSSDFFNVFAA